jgi:hypothetical protein
MRKLIVAAVATVLVLPAALAGAKTTPASSSANQACHALRHDLGAATFRQTYGTNHNRANAMGKCRSAERRAHAGDRKAASVACKAQRADDPAAFTATYGTGKHGHNALGRCIAQGSKDKADQRHHKTVNAARACRTERSGDSDAFRHTYGTNTNKRNAFGRCVRAHVHAD